MLTKMPNELIEKIFLYTDFQTCVLYNRLYESKKLYNKEIHTCFWAAKKNYLHVIQWIYHYGKIPKCDLLNAMIFACKYKYNNLINYIFNINNFSKRILISKYSLLNNIGHNIENRYTYFRVDWVGYTEFLNWLKLNFTCSKECIIWAIENNYIPIAKCIFENNIVLLN
jgi:hypothetical protein